jgi:hypothetical protein
VPKKPKSLPETLSVSNVAMNRGYFYAVKIVNSRGVSVHDNVFYRSHLPALSVEKGEGNRILRNLGVVGIFWNTHRGALMGNGMANAKLEAMIGMYDDQGVSSVFLNNVASGSERAAFSGVGVACEDTQSFVGNEGHSCLAGYWFNGLSLHMRDNGECLLLPLSCKCREIESKSCAALTDFRTWKIHLYGIYGEIPTTRDIQVKRTRIADAQAGTFLIMVGDNKPIGVRKRVRIMDSLFISRSDNEGCGEIKGV